MQEPFVKAQREVLDVPISIIGRQDLLNLLAQLLQKDVSKPLFIVTPNAEIIMKAEQDEEFLSILRRADIAVADGTLVTWALKKKYGIKQERITGIDLMQDLCAIAAMHQQSIFLLGAEEGVAERCAQQLQLKYPNVRVSGTFSGSPGADIQEWPQQEREKITTADLLFVAYGAPAQEKWLYKNLAHLQNIKIAMGVGGSFDVIAGVLPRAPEWMQKKGLEWVFRFFVQPWRWKRMLALPRFIYAVLKEQ